MSTPALSEPLLNRPLCADMGAAVIAHLSAHCELPETGYLAGQAVTSALLALYGDGRRAGPINDVDVFYTTQHGNDKPWIERSDARDHDGEVFARKVVDYGRHDLVNSSGRGIAWVAQQGSLNVICMEGGENISGLVRDFDFNLVSVGVDLSTGQMAWDPSFEAFIADPKAALGQARSVRSFARALKKQDEMPWIEWDIPAIARHTFDKDLRNLAEGITPVVHAGIQALLDKYDPEGHYPTPDRYIPCDDLGFKYPSTLIEPGSPNPLGLPSVAQVIEFRDRCAAGQIEDLKRTIAGGFPVAMPLEAGGINACDLTERHQHAETFCFLAQQGVPVTFDAVYHNGPLHRAAALGMDEFLKRVDLSLFDIDTQAKDGRTALSLAAKFGQASACRILIDRGAAIEGRNINVYLHHTPFLDAIGWGRLECAQVLQDRGANVKALLADGRTAFHAMAMNLDTSYPTGANGLYAGDFFTLLTAAGMDLHQAGDDGNTPLYDAVLHNRFEMVKAFVDHGADQRAGIQGTPFNLASARSYEDICVLFVASGFEVTPSMLKHANDKTRRVLKLTRAQASVLTLTPSELVDRLDESPDHSGAWNFANEVLSDSKRILGMLHNKAKRDPDDLDDWGQFLDVVNADKANILTSWVARRHALDAIAELDEELFKPSSLCFAAR